MDHGAWPFFVDGVTRLVEEKKKREDEREKKREEMKEDQEKMKRERERERDERRCIFSKKKNVSGPSNPPDELAQNVSKKNPRRTIFPPFFCKSAESGRF